MRREAGFPVMLKAVAGGGGKGMRRVDREAELAGAFETASSEALRAFGDGRIYVEKLIEQARHVEIQVIGRSAREHDASGRAGMFACRGGIRR